ncbi:MAG: glycosyltransferase family 2 protein, partial [Bacteroidales bacterium]|nr:glycosyltransferase family 2 protein [Bacteroidales bacterium]
MKLSVVISVYNEESNIRPLVAALGESLSGINHEIIFVDDGSSDRTAAEVLGVRNDHIRLIRFTRNYGQSQALAAGIDHAQGDYICTMDGDLQNDPSDIPGMLSLAEKEGWDLVAGIRSHRKDDMFLRKIPSRIANAIIRRTTHVRIRDYGCTLKVFRSRFAKN